MHTHTHNTKVIGDSWDLHETMTPIGFMAKKGIQDVPDTWLAKIKQALAADMQNISSGTNPDALLV